MTREEAIKAIQDFIGWFKEDSLIRKALDMAIKALSQEPICDRDCEHCTWTECPIEPCDDTISREDAEQMFRNIRSHLKPQDYKSAEEFNTRDLMLLNAEQMIHALPSVTQKSGQWINDKNDIPICSRCGYIPQFDRAIDDYEYSNYCPSCGCRMVEPQESEDKE